MFIKVILMEKNNLIIVFVVAIVAILGMFFMTMNNGGTKYVPTQETSYAVDTITQGDLAGQAINANTRPVKKDTILPNLETEIEMTQMLNSDEVGFSMVTGREDDLYKFEIICEADPMDDGFHNPRWAALGSIIAVDLQLVNDNYNVYCEYNDDYTVGVGLNEMPYFQTINLNYDAINDVTELKLGALSGFVIDSLSISYYDADGLYKIYDPINDTGLLRTYFLETNNPLSIGLTLTSTSYESANMYGYGETFLSQITKRTYARFNVYKTKDGSFMIEDEPLRSSKEEFDVKLN